MKSSSKEWTRRTLINRSIGNGGPTSIIFHEVMHRSLRHVVENLRKSLIAPLERLGEVDLFFHSWDVGEIHNPRAGEHEVAVERREVTEWLPGARGVFDSQDEFDATVEWGPLFARNFMRHFTGTGEGSRKTLMNYRRALESQERAWRFFEETNTRNYDVVVVTRGDLRFLEELGTSNIERSTSNVEGERIWVPRFHSWGGVNDRFAMGGEKEMGIYCRRAAFADEWMSGGRQGNPEQILMAWLEKNQMRVELLEFVFQRIRANGSVAELDSELVAAKGKVCGGGSTDEEEGAATSLPPNERFLILAREAGPAAESLATVLEPLGKVEVIMDRMNGAATDDGRNVFVTDEEAEGYGGLMSTSGPFPKITAWSRAMVHLARTLKPDEAVWFVEDDVAGDAGSFAE